MSSPGASTTLTPTAVKTGAYTASAGDLVPANVTGGGFPVTLPTSPTAGQSVGVYKYDSSANVVTVAGTIDGQTNAVISTQNAGATFEYVGGTTGWKITSVYTTNGPQGNPGPQGNMGSNGQQPIHVAGTVGRWYECFGLPTSTFSNRTIAAGTGVMGVPVIAQEDITIDQIACYIGTAGSAGAVVRLGLYQVTSSTAPFDLTLGSGYATLVAEGTTQPDATTTGQKTASLTSPVTITKGTAFGVLVVPQVAAVGLDQSSYPGNSSPWGCSSVLGGPAVGVLATGITGALPATFTPSAYGAQSGGGGGGWYHRSA